MRLLAAITDPVVAERILRCMDLPARAPPLEPADICDAPADLGADESAAADFDQTPPENYTFES